MSDGLLHFPDGFLWGVATSAYQIEGAWDRDGRGESIWDRFSHTPGRITGRDTGDVACAHYDHYLDDVAAMARMGVRSYRLSLAWPRLFPDGRGRPNQAGVDFYRRLIGSLRERGILPMVTLFHWDLPQALQEKGGWVNRDTAYWFADYAAFAFEQFGADVPFWLTHNEPFNVTFFGHVLGRHAPGHRRVWRLLTIAHHLLLSHGLAVQAFRSTAPRTASDLPPAQIGIALAIWPAFPATSHPADVAANHRFDTLGNRLFLELLFKAHYPEDVMRFFRRRLIHPPVRPGDLDAIASPIDFLGVNTYSRIVNRAVWYDPFLGVRPVTQPGLTTAMGWEIFPACVYDAALIAREYTALPLYITENGAAFHDELTADGSIDDAPRIAYLHAHLAELHRLFAAGVDLRGYYVWSLLDNFEWEWGYSKRFGLLHVDFATKRRTWKRSAYWYRDLIARNALRPDDPTLAVVPTGEAQAGGEPAQAPTRDPWSPAIDH
ncbi:MAG: beta-glucosidase [Chloroflexi bacterium]|nr:beta-glucosidase [Chloroflexota bacterium]